MARGHYETYDRRGPEIFVGEWAAYETPFEPWNARSRGEPPTPNMQAAIGDAAFMTQMEKNSDVVVMNCYAPLLVNVGPGGQFDWRPRARCRPSRRRSPASRPRSPTRSRRTASLY